MKNNNIYTVNRITGVYCGATCPQITTTNNSIYLNSIEDCISQGYQECKACKPLSSEALRKDEPKNSSFLKYISWLETCNFPPKSYKDHPFDSLETLNKTKTVFQKHYKISLGKYIRIKRCMYILSDISPKYCNEIFFSYIDTPLGTMVACDSSNGICLLEFVDRKMLETELNNVRQQLLGSFIRLETDYLLQLKHQLNEYFTKKRFVFDIKLDYIGTEFQKNVWSSLTRIPYGKTCTYLEQATSLKKPKAVRAIANANGKNTISIIVPCHRVIGSNGKMVGYGGGIDRKIKLISLEEEGIITLVNN